MLRGHLPRVLSHPTKQKHKAPVATGQCPILCFALHLPLNLLHGKEPPPRHVSPQQLRRRMPFRGLRSISTRRGNMAAELAISAYDDVSEAMAIEGRALLSDGTSVPGGLNSTLNRLSKWIVASLFGVVILWRHDAEVLWAAMGSILNAWLSITLKRIINHQRPFPNLKSGPGMPSSHAQSIFYASVFLVLFMARWLGINVVTLMTGAFALASSTYLSWLRVSQQCHTPSQILVGAIVGSLFATTWFWSWHAFMLNGFKHSIWVRLIVVMGSILSCVGFLFYVILHWLKDEK